MIWLSGEENTWWQEPAKAGTGAKDVPDVAEWLNPEEHRE